MPVISPFGLSLHFDTLCPVPSRAFLRPRSGFTIANCAGLWACAVTVNLVFDLQPACSSLRAFFIALLLALQENNP
jgi:hypothetical protein